MATKYIFFIGKVTKWYPKFVRKSKRVELKGRSYEEAKSFLEVLYPGWVVEMFWPDWNPKQNP